MRSQEFSSRNPELAINDWNLQSTVRNPESKTQVLVYLTLGKRISAIMQVTVPGFTVGYLTQVPRFLHSFLSNPSFTRLSNVAETQVGLW